MKSLYPSYEADRLLAMYHIKLQYENPEKSFDDIVSLASYTSGMSISAICFIDKEKVCFKAKLGILTKSLPLETDLFALKGMGEEMCIIEDTFEDTRFFASPLVSADTPVRFFAAVPLISKDNFIIGYLSVMDHKPATLTEKQADLFKKLADQVVSILSLRLQIIDEKDTPQCSNSLFGKIFHNAIIGAIVLDSNGRIIQWNPKAENIFGWNREEAFFKDFNNIIIPPENRESFRRELELLKQNHPDTAFKNTKEITALRKDLKKIEINLGLYPVNLDNTDFFVCFVSDITETKLITQKLDKQKEFYENILNSIPTDIAVFDPDHKYLFVNPGAVRNADLRKYIIGKDDFEYAAHRNWDLSIAQKRREKFLEAKRTGKEIKWEDNIKDEEGNIVTYLRRLFPVYDKNRNLMIVIGYGIGISERKAMEEKQEALVKQLSTQNVQLIDFCNIVSHNLRAPLVNMSMLVRLIEENRNVNEQRQMIEMLNPVIENLSATFNELVESIQIKQDVEIKPEKIELQDCIKRTLEGLDQEIKKSEAVFDFNIDEAPHIYFIPKYIHSIFHNLLSNALKYQSPHRKLNVQVATKKIDDKVLLTVKDNGLGIDLEKHGNNIFKIGKVFHRHPNAKGFGLFMTKTQIESLEGRIWVESIPDQGSTFFIEFKNQKN